MPGVSTVDSTFWDDFKRLVVKVLFRGRITAGKGDLRTPVEASPYGVDSNPVRGKKALYMKTDVDGKYFIVGYLNTERLAEVGEVRLFSTDTDGAFKFNLWLRADGTALIGDSAVPADYTNNLTKYNETKEENDKLKATVNDLVQKWNTFCQTYVPGSPSTAGMPATLATSQVQQNQSDFSKLKHDKIKTL